MPKLLSLFFVWCVFLFPQLSWAHGTMEVPISRIYNCYKENPENPKSAACKAAIQAGGTGAIYDWNGVNQAAANDRHQELIPDGKLCAGGRDLFVGMNLARTDWTTTTIAPNGSGQFEFVFLATAPHATKYFRFYITKPTYDFNQPLKWSDLEPTPFCTINSVTLQNGRYRMVCPFPQGGGKRIVFVIWQRSDSPEAFYSCSDVNLSGSVQTTWKELDDFFANADVAPNTRVNFRLFKHETEAVNQTVKILPGQTQANQWPYYLALGINNASSLVHIGQLNAQSGNVEPVMSASLNKVYVQETDLTGYHFALDFYLPTEGVDFIYPDSIATYQAGTIVLGRDQKRYQCKPFPASGWCSKSPLYYEPGFGLAWQQAWNLLG